MAEINPLRRRMIEEMTAPHSSVGVAHQPVYALRSKGSDGAPPLTLTMLMCNSDPGVIRQRASSEPLHNWGIGTAAGRIDRRADQAYARERTPRIFSTEACAGTMGCAETGNFSVRGPTLLRQCASRAAWATRPAWLTLPMRAPWRRGFLLGRDDIPALPRL
jgi:hypothetical protein